MRKFKRTKKLLLICLCGVLIMSLITGCGGSSEEEATAKVFTNGNIYTVEGDDWEKNAAQAMAVDADGKILLVGSNEEAQEKAGEGAEVIDLEGKTVLPGLIDGHVHAPGTATTDLYQIDLFSSFTKEDTLKVIEDYVKENPDEEMYFGTGYNMGMVDENGDTPNAAWLDEVVPDKAVTLQSNDMHSYWMNSKAMELCGITKDTETKSEGNIHRNDDGSPSGVFTDVGDIEVLEPEYTDEQQIEALEYFIKMMNEWGYTSIMSIAPYFSVDVEKYADIEKEGNLTLRINAAQFIEPDDPEGSLEKLKALKDTLESDMIKVTTGKYMVDGVVEGATAYLKEPYAESEELGSDYNSKPEWEAGALTKSYTDLIDAGFQTHSHVIGDAGVAMALDSLEEAGKTVDVNANRSTFTHVQVVDEPDFERMADMDVIADLQPFWFLKEPEWFEPIDKHYLGEARAENEYPAKSFIDSGVMITSSGDFPVSPVNNPFWAIEAGVTRNIYSEDYYEIDIEDPDDPEYLLGPDERLTVKEMLEAYTINGATQLFREDEVGSLAEGKLADFIVIDNDPFEIDILKMDQMQVLTTYLAGSEVSKAD